MITLEHSIKEAIGAGDINKAKGIELANDPDDLLDALLDLDADALKKDRKKREVTASHAAREAEKDAMTAMAAVKETTDTSKPITFGRQKSGDKEDDWLKQQQEWKKQQQERWKKK